MTLYRRPGSCARTKQQSRATTSRCWREKDRTHPAAGSSAASRNPLADPRVAYGYFPAVGRANQRLWCFFDPAIWRWSCGRFVTCPAAKRIEQPLMRRPTSTGISTMAAPHRLTADAAVDMGEGARGGLWRREIVLLRRLVTRLLLTSSGFIWACKNGRGPRRMESTARIRLELGVRQRGDGVGAPARDVGWRQR